MKLVKRLTPYLFLLLLHGLNPGHVLQHDRVYAPCVTTCLPLSHTQTSHILQHDRVYAPCVTTCLPLSHTNKHPMYCSMTESMPPVSPPACLCHTHTHTHKHLMYRSMIESMPPVSPPVCPCHTHTNISCTAA